MSLPQPDGVEMGQILVVEDDAELLELLLRGLREEGFKAIGARTGHQALARADANDVDAMVVDVGLPDADGRDVCQALRARGVVAPVLFLTARGSVPDRLSGFHPGGDDYLTKPFALAELLVRVDALLRRAAVAPPPGGETVDFVLDPGRHAIRKGEREEPLTPTEFRILASLAGAGGEVVRRQALVSAAWPDGAIVHDNTLHVYLGRIRRKLRGVDASARIDPVRGVGYRLR